MKTSIVIIMLIASFFNGYSQENKHIVKAERSQSEQVHTPVTKYERSVAAGFGRPPLPPPTPPPCWCMPNAIDQTFVGENGQPVPTTDPDKFPGVDWTSDETMQTIGEDAQLHQTGPSMAFPGVDWRPVKFPGVDWKPKSATEPKLNE